MIRFVMLTFTLGVAWRQTTESRSGNEKEMDSSDSVTIPLRWMIAIGFGAMVMLTGVLLLFLHQRRRRKSRQRQQPCGEKDKKESPRISCTNSESWILFVSPHNLEGEETMSNAPADQPLMDFLIATWVKASASL